MLPHTLCGYFSITQNLPINIHSYNTMENPIQIGQSHIHTDTYTKQHMYPTTIKLTYTYVKIAATLFKNYPLHYIGI